MKKDFKLDFEGKRIWMYWPDTKARQFSENAENGFMACELPDGYDIGDINAIGNRRIAAAVKAEYGYLNGSSVKLMTTIFSGMNIGDYVIARSDFDNIVGLGIVCGDYYYDESRTNFKHCRHVEWIDTRKWTFPEVLKRNGKWHRITLIDREYRQIAEQIISWICEEADDSM